jgi:predicted ATP-dependent endonuclease of OLD family
MHILEQNGHSFLRKTDRNSCLIRTWILAESGQPPLLKADGDSCEKRTLILAIEEPENHIAPQLLGRVIKNLKVISEQSEIQVVLTSHTPAIIKRISPEAICHFRINGNYTTVVKTITLQKRMKLINTLKKLFTIIQRYILQNLF